MELHRAPLLSYKQENLQVNPKTSPAAMLAANYLVAPQPTPWRSPRESSASMKVFTTVMLHAWRQRREEVRQLQQSVQRLEKGSMKAKNQLHVYSTLMRVEQRRNSELQLQLKQSTLSISQVRSSCDSLTNSVLSLTADKSLLEQELNYRKKEYEVLEGLSSQTKSALFGAIMEQRSLQNELSKERRAVQHLTRDNRQLLEEVMKVRNVDSDYAKIENKYRAELEQKDDMMRSMRKIIEGLEQQVDHWTIKGKEVEVLRESEESMSTQISELQQQIEELKANCTCRLVKEEGEGEGEGRGKKRFWRPFFRFTSGFLYLFWLYLLPAMPMSLVFAKVQGHGGSAAAKHLKQAAVAE